MTNPRLMSGIGQQLRFYYSINKLGTQRTGKMRLARKFPTQTHFINGLQVAH